MPFPAVSIKSVTIMNRKLFTQIRNEWKSNLWLAIELLIVSVVIWYISDFMYVKFDYYMKPRGFDIENCYLLMVSELTEKAPDYKEVSWSQSMADKQELLDRLSRRPEIEAAALSNNSRPYTGSNSGISLHLDTMHTQGYVIRRYVTPDFVKVFRYQGMNGETPGQLAEIIDRGELIPSDNTFNHYGVPVTDLIGREAYIDYDTLSPKRIGASLLRVRYNDWADWGMDQTVVLKMPNLDYGNEWVVRVKENMDHNFAENLMKDADGELRVGNYYVSDVQSMADLRTNFQKMSTDQIRNYMTGMGFLLLNVFLGLLGTFWFRTQQRVKEIAIRKVTGATRRSVFGRLIGEGVLILSVVTLPALAVDFILAKYGYNTWYAGTFLAWDRMLICAGVSYLLILLMIVAGISIPANRAMKTEPALALHDE